jgi:hypothetical protein
MFGLREHTIVFQSDYVLKQEGFQQLVQRIKQYRGSCRISILGGSHSAFSVLYLLINGPCKIRCFEEMARRVKSENRKAANS